MYPKKLYFSTLEGGLNLRLGNDSHEVYISSVQISTHKHSHTAQEEREGKVKPLTLYCFFPELDHRIIES